MRLTMSLAISVARICRLRRWLGNQVGIASPQHIGEVALRIDLQEIRRASHRIDQAIVQVDLRVAEDDREFGPRQALLAIARSSISLRPAGIRGRGRVSRAFKVRDQAPEFVETFGDSISLMLMAWVCR